MIAPEQDLLGSAQRAGALDISYRTLDTPIGSLLLAATSTGLIRVGFGAEDHDQILQALAERVSPRILHAPAQLDGAARQIGEYFAGRRRSFGLPLDLRLPAGFRRTALGKLLAIGYGQTTSYAAVAAAAGRPRAARAVGAACAANPLPVIIPCHRVVGSDGSLCGYLGGLAAKRLLLELEAAGCPA